MKDPIMEKLKSDAGIVFVDLWRILRHQPAVEDEWMHPRIQPSEPEVDMAEPKSPGPGQSGLCYFHLN